jgi:hypothetical protein
MLTISTIGKKWQLYWGYTPLPTGAEALGIVQRETHETGALIRLNSGQYVQGNAGAIRTLPQREVIEALERSAAAASLGSMSSAKKAAAARENGKRGGRPRKNNQPTTGQETKTMITIKQIDTRPQHDPYVNIAGHTSYSEFWLDARDGECGVSQEYRTNSTTFDVYHGHVRTHRLDGHPSEIDIRRDLEAHADLIQRVLAGYESHWNGNNHAARYTPDAEAAWEMLCRFLDSNQTYYEYWDVEDYIQYVMEDEVTAQTTDDEIRKLAETWAMTDPHIVLSGDVDDMVSIATAYRDGLREPA